MNFANSSRATPSEALPAGTTENCEASKDTAPKMFSIGETQTDTPRAKSDKFGRHLNRRPPSTCQSVLGSSPGTPRVETSSPGFSFNVPSPLLTGLSSDPKNTPCSAPTGFVFIGPSKPSSSAVGLLSTAVTPGCITGGNTPTSPGTIFGQNSSILSATSVANGSTLEALSSGSNLYLSSKPYSPANPVAVTGVTPPQLSVSTPSSTSTGSTLGNATLIFSSSGIFSDVGSSKPVTNSVFTGTNCGTPASRPSTGFNFTASTAPPASIGSSPFAGFIPGTAVSNTSTGSIFRTPLSCTSIELIFGTPVSSTSTGQIFGTSVSSTSTVQIFGTPISTSSFGTAFVIPASSRSTEFTLSTTSASDPSATTSEPTGRIFGTPASLSFSLRAAAPHTTSNESSFLEVTTSTGTGFHFGRAPFTLTGAFPLNNTTAPTHFAAVTSTSGSQASLGTVTTVTNSSSGDKYNNVRISSSENNSDNDKNKMKEDPQSSKFTTTFESFFPLVDNDYWIRARREPQFHENISLSMYRYYMAQHLYARLVQIRAAKGLATRDEQKFANHVQSVAPSIPNGIFIYLKNIGDIQVLHNVTSSPHFFEYSFLTWPNKDGHFGKLNHENHWMYMSFPAPVIVTQAIEEDLDMDDMNPHSFWDLRNNIKPSYSYALKTTPNANCLGWKPATILTISQRQKLQLCGIFQDSFDVINSQFQFNPKIMGIIHDYLQESPRAIINVEKYYEKRSQRFGGIEQLAWLERDDEGGAVPFSKTFASVERNVQGMLHPALGMGESASKLALIMGFRVDKSKGSNGWVVYDGGNYKNIPQTWIETRNKVFEFGDIGSVGGREIPRSWRRDAMRHEFLEKCYQGMHDNE